MDRCLLRSAGASSLRPESGFTLIEVMAAMVITITVTLASLYMVNTAQKNLAYSRALTDATNHARNKIADFKARVVTTQPCYDAGTKDFNNMLRNFSFSGNDSPCSGGDINPDYPGLENEPFCSPPESRNPGYPLLADGQPAAAPICLSPGVRNPNFVAGGTVINRTQTDTVTSGGTVYTRSWVISYADVNGDGTSDLAGDVVKAKVTVTWTQYGKTREVTLATFTTGRPQ